MKIILLTSTISAQQVIEALQIGARASLKDSAADDPLQTLRVVIAGGYWIGGEGVVNLLKALYELV